MKAELGRGIEGRKAENVEEAPRRPGKRWPLRDTCRQEGPAFALVRLGELPFSDDMAQRG